MVMPSPSAGPMSMTGPMWMPVDPPTTARLLDWHPQPIPVLPVLAAALLVVYLWGVVVLRRRGIRWPAHRIAWWVGGVAVVVAMTATGIDAYGMELFSIHMVQHMVLSMFAPVLLALGAPITLLLRALPSGSGRRGRLRRVVVRVLHSRYLVFVTRPTVVAALFLLSLYGLYYTPVFDWLMHTWWGHNLMLAHFVLVGFLYFWSVLGVDPKPRTARTGAPRIPQAVVTVLEVAVTVPFHAFFGVAVMMSTTLLVRFYSVSMPGWGTSPLADQAAGGGVAWSFTEIPTLLVLGALIVQWRRVDERRAARVDRRRDRREADELADYNAYLQSLAGTGQGR